VVIVALAVLIAVAVGVASERHTSRAPTLARRILQLMLYALVPFVSFVNIAHLHVTVAAGTGLVFAYIAIGVAGAAAGYAGRRMGLSRPEVGALICSVILVNTGYLGLPMTVTLIGPRQLGTAIAYDQLVSGPMLFIAGFGVGAAFGSRAGEGARARARSFLVRNPPLLAVVAGLLAPASLAPSLLVHASRFVVAALLPLGFFVVGVNLSAERREDAAPLLEWPDRRVLIAVGLRLLVAPLLLTGVSATIVVLPRTYLLQAAMPSAINSLLVGHAYGLDQRLIAMAIVWSTIATLTIGLVIGAL
jgi:predicted permease